MNWKTIGGAAAAVVLLVAVGRVARMYEAPTTPQQTEADRTAAHDRELVNKAEAAVLGQLRDPHSARFDDRIHVVRPGEIVCGKVNARNGFGGYTGLKAFIYDHGMLFSEEGGGNKFADLWNTECAGPTEPADDDPVAPHFRACKKLIRQGLHKGEYISSYDPPKDFGTLGRRSLWLVSGRWDDSSSGIYCWVSATGKSALIDIDPDNTSPADKALPPWGGTADRADRRP